LRFGNPEIINTFLVSFLLLFAERLIELAFADKNEVCEKKSKILKSVFMLIRLTTDLPKAL
jgi:hypothetical protein